MGRHSKAGGPVRLVLTLSVLALFAAAIVFAVSGCATVTPEEAVAAGHPTVAKDTPCTSCKAKDHQFAHRDPYKGECRLCHDTQSWNQVFYSHANVAFNQGMHLAVGCDYCHTAQNPYPSANCSTCHQSQHAFIADCASCHQAVAWRLTTLPTGHLSLTGGHKGVKCFDCHSGAKPFSHPNGCASCHGPTKHGGLTNCASCHDPSLGWNQPKKNFDHNQFFVLSGQHKSVKCIQCHPNNQFAAAKPQCSSCHGAKHGGLTNCSACHTTAGFQFTTFRHSSVWTLTGAHTHVACTKCHPSAQYAKHIGNKNSCVSCHGTKHGGLSKCAACHTTAGFRPSTFRHSSVWALTGAHKTLACTKCHPDGKYAKARKACVSCHGTHHGNQTQCQNCHTTSAFSPAKRIKHPAPISLGTAHASRPCTLCHPSLVFNRTKPCSNCHQAPHVAPTNCIQCHRPTVWSEVHFTHPAIGYHTQFPIEQACLKCHTTGNYAVFVCTHCHPAVPYP